MALGLAHHGGSPLSSLLVGAVGPRGSRTRGFGRPRLATKPPGRPSLSMIDLQGRGGVFYVLEPALLLIQTTLDP
jgi:hypothetical protein